MSFLCHITAALTAISFGCLLALKVGRAQISTCEESTLLQVGPKAVERLGSFHGAALSTIEISRNVIDNETTAGTRHLTWRGLDDHVATEDHLENIMKRIDDDLVFLRCAQSMACTRDGGRLFEQIGLCWVIDMAMQEAQVLIKGDRPELVQQLLESTVFREMMLPSNMLRSPDAGVAAARAADIFFRWTCSRDMLIRWLQGASRLFGEFFAWGSRPWSPSFNQTGVMTGHFPVVALISLLPVVPALYLLFLSYPRRNTFKRTTKEHDLTAFFGQCDEETADADMELPQSLTRFEPRSGQQQHVYQMYSQVLEARFD